MDISSNMLRIIVILFSMMLDLVISGNGDFVSTKCGNLSIETPTILGRNVTFSFTPDTHDPNANLTWQQRSIDETTCSTLNLTHRFTQYQDDNTFYLVLMDSVKQDGQQHYCVNYSSNETTPCSIETKKLDLEERSFIKFNISGSELNITGGKQVHVECLVENNSTSNISWIEEKSNVNVTMKKCSLVSICVLSIYANATSTRRFICLNYNLTRPDHKRLTVNILDMSKENEEYTEKQKNIEHFFNKFILWIILGSCLLVTGIIITVVLFVVISKRRQNPKEKKESPENYRATVGKVRNQHNPVYDLQECQNEAEHSHEIADEEPAYSQPLKPRTRENKDNLYSNVNDDRTSAQERHADSGKLCYADLDFDPNETPSKGGVFKRRDPSTEYADIDFPKTNTQKDIARTIVEREKNRSGEL